MDGNKIRIKRVLAGMSQEELSNSAKVDRAYISLIETGKKTPTLAVLERIAVALGCSVKDFF